MPTDNEFESDNLTDAISDDRQITTEALSNLERIEAALPQVKGLEEADTELDELANLAINSFKDLQDLGMQVEARFSSEILSAASSLLGHAITARTAKVNKKLKMIQLQLQKATLDAKNKQKEDPELPNTPLGEGRELDRNEILKMFSNKKSEGK